MLLAGGLVEERAPRTWMTFVCLWFSYCFADHMKRESSTSSNKSPPFRFFLSKVNSRRAELMALLIGKQQNAVLSSQS
jgi:hypothetical protein